MVEQAAGSTPPHQAGPGADMAGDLKKLASFTTVTEAAMLRNLLEREGIPAVLSDEQVVGLEFILGNAIGWIKVEVQESDFERAQAILAARDERAAAVAPDMELGEPEPDSIDEDLRDRTAPHPEEDGPPETPTEARIRRAYLAAVLGLFACPPLFNLYSMYLLLRVAFSGSAEKPRNNWKYYAAWVADFVSLAGIWLYYWYWIGY
jgi:hypothetical protein